MPPTFAEMIYGTAQNVAQNAGQGLPEAVSNGAKLAMESEQLQNQKAALIQKREELKQAQWDKVGKLYEIYDKLPDGSPARKTFGSKVIPANLSAMGLAEDLNPAVLDMLTTDPQLGVFMSSKALSGEVTNAEIQAAVKDSEKFGKLVTRLGIKSWADEKMLKGTADKFAPDIAKAEASHQSAQAQSARANAYGINAQRGLDEQAKNAPDEFTNDQLIKRLTTDAGNVRKAQDLLHTKNPSMKVLNEVAQDISRVLSGQNASSDYKLKQTEISNFETEFADIVAKATSDPDTPAPKQVVEFWKRMAHRLQETGQTLVAQRAKNIGVKAEGLYKGNPVAKARYDQSYKDHVSGEALGFNKTVMIGGKSISVDRVKELLKSNPNDPKADEARKALKEIGE